MLKTGAILNFLVAAGHLACLPWLYPVLSIYRIDGIMETLALRYGAAIPYLLTVGRRRELNPCPKMYPWRLLRAQSILSIPFPVRESTHSQDQ